MMTAAPEEDSVAFGVCSQDFERSTGALEGGQPRMQTAFRL